MLLIITIVGLIILRYLEIGPFAELSWWWIIGLMGVAFLWFEFIERALGLDKRKAHDESERLRKERVDKAFKKR
jgi:small Trp-rich protein